MLGALSRVARRAAGASSSASASAAATARSGSILGWQQHVRALQNLTVGVVPESMEGEKRVALVPKGADVLIKKGAKVQVASGAGLGAGFADADYEAVGASVVSSDDAWGNSDMVVKVRPPTSEEAAKLGNRILTGIVQPRVNTELMSQFAKQKSTVLSMDSLMRTLSRGQAFDVLSSQANIAGYRAVMEAASHMQRPFAGQMTSAGRINPAKVIVVGAGVAGLAAIQTAKNLNAMVNAFDVRAAAAEQVESMGAKFLRVESEEDGSGSGGYAKEMSPEWFEAARKMLLEECKDTDVIITTALIPGKKAPVLITEDMIKNMPNGGVVVDLAAEAGGNIATTEPNKVVVKHGVTHVGHTNLPSLMSNTASTLFSGNVSKLILSMDRDGTFVIDEEDPAVRSMLCMRDGKPYDPYVPPPPSPEQLAAEAAKKAAAEPVELTPDEIRTNTRNHALKISAATTAALAVGSTIPNSAMLSTLALSCWVGNQAVRGVTHALHSPLMSVTNAISGMTIVGGMLQMGGGVLPSSMPQTLGAFAVALSAINLAGGFMVTHKMLDMFRRPTDPPEYNNLYLIPGGIALTGAGLWGMSGAAPAALMPTLALGSALGCIGGITCLSSQETSRLGNVVAMSGVSLGIAATLGIMDVSPAVMTQLGGAALIGGLAGQQIAKRVGPTELPQAVAGFHSLVGLAATSTAVGDFLLHDLDKLDNFHMSSIYLGAWMGAITMTGSVIACGKLAELFDSKPLALPGRDVINGGMGLASAAAMYGFVSTESAGAAGGYLAAGTALSGALGLHMTASIGGADMPVVITLLNSYSGWALCAEGFILDQPLLTIVGALIGSSGAFLTYIMCEGMNRSLPSVILGGLGSTSGAVATKEGLTHKETDTEGSVQALLNADSVLIVPGYGLAVAQAQQNIADIANNLRKLGKDVKFAVHPVAGRMPGQLNVLLAEAGVPYDMVFEMEDINDEIPNTDVCLVVGANDTVNSAAETEPDCEIAGMPVIRVWEAGQVIFMKRSMASGYAGVDNPVFYNENTDMLLGNAKDTTAAIRTGIEAAL